jgi:eukaryotic translation initiation factor 2C
MLMGSTTMLMGIDVTHAGAGALSGAPSIAAVVGSTNDQYSQFPAVLRTNARGPVDVEKDGPLGRSGRGYGPPTEEVLGLREMARESIEKWMAHHSKALPERLIVFRDGLSEEQLDMCRSREIPRIRAAIQDLKDPSKPSKFETELLVICTVKRHHVQFFRDEAFDSSKLQEELFPSRRSKKDNANFTLVNPPPGTLIDTRVTLDDSDARGDFFLISHDVLGNKGTARPTHYVVLENGFRRQPVTKQDIAEMVSALDLLLKQPPIYGRCEL